MTAVETLSALLRTVDLSVVEWVAGQHTGVAAGQRTPALQVASSVDVGPVFWMFDENLAVVVRACEGKPISEAAFVFGVTVHELDDFRPDSTLANKHLGIAKNVESAFGSRQGDADAVIDVEEPDFIALVAPD